MKLWQFFKIYVVIPFMRTKIKFVMVLLHLLEDIEFGVCGNVVIKDGLVSNISYISSLNFRISHQIPGASDKVIRYVLDIPNNTVFNSLIVSPPGCGKTTIIRDIAKKISNGMSEINFRGIDVTVIDERGEIAALNRGISCNDVRN